MTTVCDSCIHRAEPLADGVFIEFSDGKSAFYPATFLRSHMPWYMLDLIPMTGEEPRLYELAAEPWIEVLCS